MSYILKHRASILFGFIFVILTALFQLVIPWIIRYTIDYITFLSGDRTLATGTLRTLQPWLERTPSQTILLTFAAAILGLSLVQGVFRFFMRNILIGISRKIEYELRNDYFKHLQGMSLSFFHRHQTGELMALATNDISAIRSMLGPGIMQIANISAVFVVAIFLMLKISPSLTVVALLPSPIVFIIVQRLLGKIHKLFESIQEQFSTLTSKVEENVSGIRVVKAYVQENNEIETFRGQNVEYIHRNLALTRVRANLRAQIEFILGTLVVLILWVGGRQVILKQLSIGSLVAFLTYLGMLAWPMIAVGWILNLWQQGMASVKRILKVMNEPPEICDSEVTDHSTRQISGEIEFKNLSFSYSPGSVAVLQNISLKIKAGTSLAIVGPTGAGKSTLVNLIPRLLESRDGELLIDGKNIKHVPLQVLRKNIGMVPQESFLFSDTLHENIIFGVDFSPEHEIEEAVETSQIKRDFDQFPQGLQTIVGERGITLSGGQKQRTAISRAVIRKPKILILDDALSAVDTYTEEEILKRLKKVMQDRTSIIVSHRISTVRHADHIIVLENGRITEQGSHESLIRKKGFYHRLHRRQQLEKSLEQL